MIGTAIATVVALVLAWLAWRAEARVARAEGRTVRALRAQRVLGEALKESQDLVTAQANELKRLAHQDRLLADRAKLLARVVRADTRYDTRAWPAAKPSPVLWRPGREIVEADTW